MKMDMERIRSNLKLYFVAGTDTSSAALSWVIHYMMAIPRVQQKLHEEAVQVLGTDLGFSSYHTCASGGIDLYYGDCEGGSEDVGSCPVPLHGEQNGL
ncbi:unnamed protein product [Chrysoparadoxa australica]